MNKFLKISLLILILAFSFFIFQKIKSASVTVTAIVPGVCGNGIKEIGEQCDGSDFGGLTCFNFGYSGGSLSCNVNCTLNFSGCIYAPPSGGGGGGGGGGFVPQYGKIIISGYAQPKSEVTLMSDGTIKATTIAGDDAKFSFTLDNLSPGNYLFTLYSEDKDGRRSSLYTFPVKLEAGQTITAGNILLSPTIDVDKSEVKRGDFISIFGYSQPEANILINVSSEEELFFRTNANKDGFYLYQLGTDILEKGDHFTKSKSILANQLVSNYSRVVSFKVSDRTIPKEAKKVCGKADLNCDGRVNLIDFSIAAYWYKRKLSPAFALIEKERLNGDGKVDLVDFSIMAYYWTG
jgi:hypothetical protein